MTCINTTNAAPTTDATDIDDGDWKLVCGGRPRLSSEHITIAIVVECKCRTTATTAMTTHCNVVEGVGIYPIDSVISRGGMMTRRLVWTGPAGG